jgi:beta-ribofuranosylaminobenzene 5'-phosphate synthase
MVVLIIPKVPGKFFGRTELDIFKQFCPVPANEVEKVSHIILFQVIPSIVEKDLNTFGEALSAIRNIGFKKVEISQQHPIVKDIIQNISVNSTDAVGLSSMGPTVYAIYSKGDDPFEWIPSVEKIQKKYSIECEVIRTKGYNNGALVQIHNESWPNDVK